MALTDSHAYWQTNTYIVLSEKERKRDISSE
jgi:hypothetical protein